jgi:hydroxypyruvate reductase
MSEIIQQMRSEAITAFHAAVAAVQPENLVPNAVRADGDVVEIWGEALPEVSGRRVLAAIGKAAPGLAEAWLELLPDWADELFVLTPHGVPVSERIASEATLTRGAHPYPDDQGVASTRRLLELAAGLGEKDLLMVLLSGGGSALMAAPEEGLELEDLQATTKALLEAGAKINDVNAVRRQLMAAAGGGLGRAASPAQVVTLVLSDVLGDPLSDIASGPTVPSSTTVAHALGVLGGYGIVGDLPPAVVDFLRSGVERPVDNGWAERSRIQVLANNRTAVDAAAACLSACGYHTLVHPGFLEGEASQRGALLAELGSAIWSRERVAFVVGGETTVTVQGSGVGGRNHELALAAALALEGPVPRVVLSAGTDGVDGLAEAAGAVVDPSTVSRLRAAGIDARVALENNDSGTALATVDDAIHTGATGTNVCDLTMVLSSG